MTELPKSKGKKFIKAESDKKVTEEASRELTQEVEAYARERASQAVAEATEDGRKTVRKEDIRDSK